MFQECASPRSEIVGGRGDGRLSLSGEKSRGLPPEGDSSPSVPWVNANPTVFGDAWQRPPSHVDSLRSLVRRVTGAVPPPEVTLEDVNQRTDDLAERMSDLDTKFEDLDEKTEQLDILTRDLSQRAAFMEIPDVQTLARRVDVLEETLAWMNIKTLLSRWSHIERKTENVRLDTAEWQRQYEIRMKPYFAGVEAYNKEKQHWEKRFMNLEQRMGDVESDAKHLLMLGLHSDSNGEASEKAPSREAWLRLAKDMARVTQELEKTRGWLECSQRQLELLQTETDKSAQKIESLESTVSDLGEKLQAVDTSCQEIGTRLTDVVVRSLSWSEPPRPNSVVRTNSQGLSWYESARTSSTGRATTPDQNVGHRPSSGQRQTESVAPDSQGQRPSASRRTDRGVPENHGRGSSANRHTEGGADDHHRNRRTGSSVSSTQTQRPSTGTVLGSQDSVTDDLGQQQTARKEGVLKHDPKQRPSAGGNAEGGGSTEEGQPKQRGENYISYPLNCSQKTSGDLQVNPLLDSYTL